jgi:hypothetical protein
MIHPFSEKTYEEYLYDTSRALGRLREGSSKELLRYYADNSLELLSNSNSIEVDLICKNIVSVAPELSDFLADSFVGLGIEAEVNAFAENVGPAYSGHLIELKAGLLVWLHFFLAPLVSGSWFLDESVDRHLQEACEEHFIDQLKDLQQLRREHATPRQINQLSLRKFPHEEMWLEHTYYKQAALFFVVLHEIGHHILGHTSSPLTLFVRGNVRDYVDEPLSDDHRMEYEADYFAVRTLKRWLGKVAERTETKLAFAQNAYLLGPVLALLSLAYEGGQPSSATRTHPSTNARIDRYLRYYVREFSQFGTDYGMFISGFYASVLFGEDSSTRRLWSV